MRLSGNDRELPHVATFEPPRHIAAHVAAGRNVEACGRMIRPVPGAQPRHPSRHAPLVLRPGISESSLEIFALIPSCEPCRIQVCHDAGGSEPRIPYHEPQENQEYDRRQLHWISDV